MIFAVQPTHTDCIPSCNKVFKGCWTASSLDLCSVLCNFSAAGVSELCGSPPVRLLTVWPSDRHSRQHPEWEGHVYCRSLPHAKGSSSAHLPPHQHTFCLQSYTEHLSPLCLQGQGSWRALLFINSLQRYWPWSFLLPSSQKLTLYFSQLPSFNVPSVSCLSSTNSKGMILPICIYFVVVNKILVSHNILVFVLSVVILSVLVCGM